LGGLGALFEGLSPQKPLPGRRDLLLHSIVYVIVMYVYVGM